MIQTIGNWHVCFLELSYFLRMVRQILCVNMPISPPTVIAATANRALTLRFNAVHLCRFSIFLCIVLIWMREPGMMSNIGMAKMRKRGRFCQGNCLFTVFELNFPHEQILSHHGYCLC